MYMVPPFLAYYGVTTNNESMLQEAYTQVWFTSSHLTSHDEKSEQIKLYRNYLLDSSANGLWKHVVMGSDWTDPGHWSTGRCTDIRIACKMG